MCSLIEMHLISTIIIIIRYFNIKNCILFTHTKYQSNENIVNWKDELA